MQIRKTYKGKKGLLPASSIMMIVAEFLCMPGQQLRRLGTGSVASGELAMYWKAVPRGLTTE